MSSPYAGLPFLQPDKQIRLLRLEPSLSDSDNYHFNLAVHDFHDGMRPSYVAISYTWGDAVPLLPIVVNGQKMRVRFNCWYALWQMRYHGCTDYLWIDSLCINQDDDEEKNFQVAIMGSIYESALWVASCLGTGETIGVVQSTLNSRDTQGRLAEMKIRERFDQLPYFDRVWIKQEIILARDITLFYGLEKISWEMFNLLIKTIERPRDQQLGPEEVSEFDLFGDSGYAEMSSYSLAASRDWSVPTHETDTSSTTIQLCNHRLRSKSGTFIDLVLRYRTAKATNPRDKIYALLSLLPKDDLIRQNLVIDYGQSTFHLFHAIVRLVYYSKYENVEAGQKHQVLNLIREWLDIDENNPDMDNYLNSVPSSPSDWLPSSTSDLASHWLKGFDPEIILDVVELCQVHRKDELDSNLSLTDKEYTPLRFLEYINTWQRDDEKWSKADIDRFLPINLKTAKVIFKRPNIHPDISPSMQEFLVGSDVRAGDFIAMVVWDGTEDLHYDTHRWISAHAVVRAVNANTEDDFDPSQQEKDNGGPLILHSWAVPVRKDFTLLTRASEMNPSSRDLYHDQSLGELKLHHRDALIPLILNHRPLHALMYPAPEGSTFSTLHFNNSVESGNQTRQTSRVLKRKAEYDYVSDILG